MSNEYAISLEDEFDYRFIESIGFAYFKKHMIIQHYLSKQEFDKYTNNELTKDECKNLIKVKNISIKEIRSDYARMTEIRMDILKVLLRFEQMYNNFIIRELTKTKLVLISPYDINDKIFGEFTKNEVDFIWKTLPTYNFDKLILFMHQKSLFKCEKLNLIFGKKELERIKDLRNKCSHRDYIFDNKEYPWTKIFKFIKEQTRKEYAQKLLDDILEEIEVIRKNSPLKCKKIIIDLQKLDLSKQ